MDEDWHAYTQASRERNGRTGIKSSKEMNREVNVFQFIDCWQPWHLQAVRPPKRTHITQCSDRLSQSRIATWFASGLVHCCWGVSQGLNLAACSAKVVHLAGFVKQYLFSLVCPLPRCFLCQSFCVLHNEFVAAWVLHWQELW